MLANKKRSVCIWLGFAVLFALTMFPPWARTVGRMGENYPAHTVRLWHAPIRRAPTVGFWQWSVYVDYRRMLTELAVGESFVVALYLTWGRTVVK